MVIRRIFSDSDDTIALHVDKGARSLKHAYDGGGLLRLYPNVGFSIVTGQPYSHTIDVVGAVNTPGPHVYEMGYLIGVEKSEPEILLSKDDANPQIACVKRLKRKVAEDNFPAYAMKRGLRANLMLAKKAMLTFLIEPPERGKDFIGQLWPGVVSDYGDDELKKYLAEGSIRLISPGYAVDVMPQGVGKGNAVRHVMESYEINPAETLVLVDSGHSDMEMVDVVREHGYAACPANSTHDIIRAVQDFGERGYVSELTCDQGAFPDMLRHAKRTWGFA